MAVYFMLDIDRYEPTVAGRFFFKKPIVQKTKKEYIHIECINNF